MLGALYYASAKVSQVTLSFRAMKGIRQGGFAPYTLPILALLLLLMIRGHTRRLPLATLQDAAKKRGYCYAITPLLLALHYAR